MSAGAFGVARYQTDAGNLCNVKIQPETLAATIDGTANSIPLGATNQEASAIVSGGRGNGVFCRKLRLQFTGAVPDGYQSGGVVTIPWLVQAAWAGFKKNDTGTYLGSPVRVVGKTAERVG